jgi:hypothetical protein
VEALMTANLAAKSENLRHVAFRRTKYHGLRLFVDPHQNDFYDIVAEAMVHKRKRQTNALTELLYGYTFDMAAVESYIAGSLLNRVVEDTYANYVSLLNLIRGYNYSLVGPWKGSFPHSVLELHRSKTWMFRESAASYRHLILRMYTYFRDAAATRYLAPKLQKNLWLEVQNLKAGGDPDAEDRSHPTKVKCGRCGRKDLHLGGREKCTILSDFTDEEAKALVKGLTHRQVIKAVKVAKEIHNAEPSKGILALGILRSGDHPIIRVFPPPPPCTQLSPLDPSVFDTVRSVLWKFGYEWVGLNGDWIYEEGGAWLPSSLTTTYFWDY